MTATVTVTDESWRPRARRTTLWSTVAGLVIVLAATVVAWSWRDELPAQIASHWGAGGVPDNTASVTGFITVTLVMTLVLLAVFAPIGLAWGATASMRRMAAGGAVWSGAFGATMLLTMLGMQRGVDDVSTVALPGWVLAAVLVVPLVPAVVAALLVPGDPAQPATAAVPDDAPRTTARPDAVWHRRTSGGPGAIVGVVVVVGMVVLAMVTAMWALLIVPVLLGVLFAAMFAFTVHVDATGLTVRSAVGWPRIHIPADEVERATVITVHPLGDFGGWGWRAGFDAGRVGVVLHTGEAVLVERSGERSFVVTVEDAQAGAALLNTMADHARHSG